MAENKIYFTSKMQDRREELGWTRKELADLVAVGSGSEVSEASLSNWERGERPVQPIIALEVARNLQVEVKTLIERR